MPRYYCPPMPEGWEPKRGVVYRDVLRLAWLRFDPDGNLFINDDELTADSTWTPAPQLRDDFIRRQWMNANTIELPEDFEPFPHFDKPKVVKADSPIGRTSR